MSIQLPSNLVWTILVAKFFCIIYIALNGIRTGKKYFDRKSSVSFWLAITFFLYLIATITTTINTIFWYIDYELYKSNWTSTLNGIFMVLASSALLKFTFEVFYAAVSEKTKKKAMSLALIHFITVIVLSILGISWGSVHGINNNPFGTLIILFSAITYLYLIEESARLVIKLKDSQSDLDSIPRIRSICFGALFMLLSVIIVVMDYFLQDVETTGYTYLAPIGYWVLALAMVYLHNALK